MKPQIDVEAPEPGEADTTSPAQQQSGEPRVPQVTPDLPPATWRAILRLLRRLPQGALSRGFGRIADVRIPGPLRRPVLGAVARALRIDLSEAEQPLEAYASVNELFVRRLREGIRSWPEDPIAVGSPVDGVVGRLGVIHDGLLVQAKGRWYSVADLLADPAEAERFDGGAYLTLYLSPRHYHRIHAPCAGGIAQARHVPGALLPVNAPAVAHIPDLFARNERVVCTIDGPLGRVALVAVGAYNVGRISTAFDPEWCAVPGRVRSVSNRRVAPEPVRRYSPPVPVERGEEIMAFHLGSTVILLFEPGPARLDLERLRPGAEIRLGTQIVSAAR